MSADTNIKTIAQVYEAFGRGDVAAILDAVTDDVDWAAEASLAAAPGTACDMARTPSQRSSRYSARPWRWRSSRRSPSPPTRLTCSPSSGFGPSRAAQENRDDGPAPLLPVPRRQDRLLSRHRGHRPDRGSAARLTRQAVGRADLRWPLTAPQKIRTILQRVSPGLTRPVGSSWLADPRSHGARETLASVSLGAWPRGRGCFALHPAACSECRPSTADPCRGIATAT